MATGILQRHFERRRQVTRDRTRDGEGTLGGQETAGRASGFLSDAVYWPPWPLWPSWLSIWLRISPAPIVTV
jgi:hypothetical protein